MLTIRLSRIGKHKSPHYRIVLQENTQDPWAPAKEILGNYNPRQNPSAVTLKDERIKYWLSVGAQPSSTVHNILVREGVIKADKAASVSITKKRAGRLVEKKAEAEVAKAEKAEKAKAAAEAKKEEEKAAKEAAKQAKADAKAAEEKEKTEAEAKAKEEAETPAVEETAKTEESATEEAPKEAAPVEEVKAEEAPTEEKKEESAE